MQNCCSKHDDYVNNTPLDSREHFIKFLTQHYAGNFLL